MAFHPTPYGIVLKNARMDKKLTQAELAEILDISLSYLKDLERFRNNPSYELFEKSMRYFNLSADNATKAISRSFLPQPRHYCPLVRSLKEQLISVRFQQNLPHFTLI